MNIIISLHEFLSYKRSSLEFIVALCRNRGNHTIILALDGLFAYTVDKIRSAFEGIIPPENIRLWYSPAGLAPFCHEHVAWRSRVCKMLLDGFVKSMQPDVVLNSEVIEGGLLGLMGPMGSLYISGIDLEEQARLALGTLEMWYQQQQADAASSNAQIPKLRPKLAYLSPLPPEHSGVSDYSAELLVELSRFYEIDVVVEQKTVSDQWVSDNCALRTVTWFRNHAGRFDRILYHIGNSAFHLHMFDLISEFPGVVVLHDFYLSNVLAERDYSGSAPGSFAAALYRSHGYAALLQLLAAPNSRRDIVAAYPCSFSVLQHATGVIIHSEYAQSLAKRYYGDNIVKRMALIPLLRAPVQTIDRDEARRALGFKADDVVVCSFGGPEYIKLNHLLIEAWQASSLSKDERCILIFVGELNQSDYCKALWQYSKQCGSRILMSGWLPKEKYRQYLSAADIGVQLRTVSRGESSASVLDFMNYGVATILNANGSMAELPEECVMMLPDKVSVHELKDALETLRADSLLRRQLGDNARKYITAKRSPALLAERYAAAIERFSEGPEAIRSSILQKIAQDKTIPNNEATLFSVTEAIADTFQRPLQRQLLVDISALVLVDEKTGIQRVVRSIVKTLIDNPPPGFRVEPVYAAPDTPYRYARRFTLKSFGFPENMIADDVVEIQPKDIFFVPDLQLQAVQCQRDYFLRIRNMGASVFFLVHDILPIRRPDFVSEGYLHDFRRWLFVVAQSDGAICISKTVADDLFCYLNQVKPERISSFLIGWNHHGADIAASIPSKGLPVGFEETLLKLAKAPLILMVGTVEPRKGYEQVVKAFELLWRVNHEIQLVIVGKKGWMFEKLAECLQGHKELNKRLFWLENLSDEGLEKLYAAADGVVMASEGEGFGLPLIEAAQYGCPILVRDLPVFREVAGNHATYFSGNSPTQLADKLKVWIANLKNGSAIQSTGMPWCTWKESVTQIVGLLTQCHHKNWLYRLEPINHDSPFLGVSSLEKPYKKTFLHIGCGPKHKNQTTRGFNTFEWNEVRLDIDESVVPDIIGSMANMSAVENSSVDAIFSSHNIQQLYPFEVPVAFAEFRRVLKPDGFVVITCPDLQSVAALIAADKLMDPAYTSPAGPIVPLDILYGHRSSIANGNLHMAHRCGFTQKVLNGTLQACGLKPLISNRRTYPFYDLWTVASVSYRSHAAMRALAAEHFP